MIEKCFNKIAVSSSRMKDFNMFITEYLHHGWRNFWILMLWNTPEWRISKRSSQNIFTMVEENFGFRWSEMHQNEGFQQVTNRIFTMVKENFGFAWSSMLQNEGFQNVYHRISSPWLKKILDLDDLKCSRMKHFKTFITENLHHGWRKFWISMI